KRQFEKPEKRPLQTGPIDDAFCSYFWVVAPEKPGWYTGTDQHAAAAVSEFARLWDRYFRGKLPMGSNVPQRGTILGPDHPHLVLFGDPSSNPRIAEVLPKLPIIWTKDKLVVNGVEYDPKTHLPVLIYPNPLSHGIEYVRSKYIVINSGHTFK